MPMTPPTAGDRSTLAPLPEYHRRGLTVLTVFSVLSFVTTTFLWLFITFKLLSFRLHRFRWRRCQKRPAQRQEQVEIRDPDFSLGLDQRHAHPGGGRTILEQLQEMDRLRFEQDQRDQAQQQDGHQDQLQGTAAADEERAPDACGQNSGDEEEEYNPFPILVYHLLLADMQEAMAYGLSIHWLSEDGIFAPSAVCWAQGWFGSVSNLGASLFLSAISVTTFSTIVLGHKPGRRMLYAMISCIWLFTYGINAAGVLCSLRSGPVVDMGESYFMRANVWCWISSEYNPWRLWSHYFWIIVSVSLTFGLYSIVFVTLWRQKRSCRHMPMRRLHTPESARLEGEAPRQSGYHPAFLVYPFIYLVCIAPLVIGRICIIMGYDLGISYFAFAGSLLAANGLFNSALWTTTILFSAPGDMAATGLDRFSFMRTPARDYGHTVVISGPVSQGYSGMYRGRGQGQGQGQGHEAKKDRREWWWWRSGGQRGWGRSYVSAHEAVNPDLIRVYSTPEPAVVEGPFIHMNVVTRVVVEDANREKAPGGVD
ncbi:hypothetical protein KVR01_011837 [Diaporthe batatas]|uniref:uncharacterized protein n=1 Tax=Diaporthe batatas TaxID=748121 RepID=UPI001D05C11B|nr:uncharacterized protein KVR01_011837 [Diaporthe batatas]KAG8158076.1 hypothetical protein KVR01_011837 [Diaporthe batatas]